MITHLVTGYAGVEHIQAEDDGAFNAAFFGDGQFVMESGNMFEGSIIDNNTVRILDGDLLTFGRHVRIKPNTYEDLTITTGTAGTYRYDLICMTYEKNGNDGTESAYLEVLQGEETESTPTLPNYIVNNILFGATKNQMPMYKVVLEGVVLKEIVPLFNTCPTYKALADKYKKEFQTACETHLDSLNILDTMEEVQANTQEYQLVGALALKEIESNLKKSVSDGKTLLATTITDKTGIEVASDATFAEINAVLDSELNACRVYYLGTGTSFDIKTLLPDVDYTKLTVDNFICCYSDVGSAGWTNEYQHSTDNGLYPGLQGMSHAVTYTDGILTISGHKSSLKALAWDVWDGGDSGNLRTCSGGVSAIKVFLVVGDIESL